MDNSDYFLRQGRMYGKPNYPICSGGLAAPPPQLGGVLYFLIFDPNPDLMPMELQTFDLVILIYVKISIEYYNIVFYSSSAI